MKSKKCCIVIPVYKYQLEKFEVESMKQCISILGNKYDIYLVGGKDFNFDKYSNQFNYEFNIKKFNNECFSSVKSYSSLCTYTEFYKAFNNYEYMLLYQLDGWVFYDKLDYFIKLGYDYYGSPWVIDGIEGVGNGGVSLRKVSTMLTICKKYGDITGLEDRFFCIEHKDMMKICTLNKALKFGLCADSHNKYFSEEENTPCPMFAHNFLGNCYANDYWKKYIKYSDGSDIQFKHKFGVNKNNIDPNKYNAILKSILLN